MRTASLVTKFKHDASFGLGITLAALGLLRPAAAQSTQTVAVPAVVVASATAAAGNYTVVNGLAVVGPTPMLDEGGNQRLDPEGNPMFNAPVSQQRDKKGHPLFDKGGKPVFQTVDEPGYDERGKKLHTEKARPAKPMSFEIVDGAFMVNRLPVIRGVSYQVVDQQYIYIWAPGYGVAVVSQTPFPGAVEQKGALQAKSIAIHVQGRTLEIASDKPLHGKWGGDASAWVLLDRYHKLPSRRPVIGFGSTASAPYSWPAAAAIHPETASMKLPATPQAN